MTEIKKVPIYKKWWAWIILFIMVATIVNSQESNDINQTKNSVETMTNKQELESVHSCCQEKQRLLVGEDLEPGEYFIEAMGNAHAFLQLARDNSDSIESIITNHFFQTYAFLTVYEGEYLTLERATITLADEAAIPTFTHDALNDGVYRIGIDLPAGRYVVGPTTDVAGYYQIATNARGTASDMISNLNFSKEVTLTVEDGQYLTLTRAKISQQD